jgi:hypothetical protein
VTEACLVPQQHEQGEGQSRREGGETEHEEGPRGQAQVAQRMHGRAAHGVHQGPGGGHAPAAGVPQHGGPGHVDLRPIGVEGIGKLESAQRMCVVALFMEPVGLGHERAGQMLQPLDPLLGREVADSLQLGPGIFVPAVGQQRLALEPQGLEPGLEREVVEAAP